MDGSWRYPNLNASRSSVQNYSLLETFRNLGILVEKYGLNKDHSSIKRAAEYLFSCQTDEGDFRGILGNQHMPYYSGVIMELLIKAGYGDNPSIDRGFKWLLSVRQNDDGWNIPMRTVGLTYSVQVLESPPSPQTRRSLSRTSLPAWFSAPSPLTPITVRRRRRYTPQGS